MRGRAWSDADKRRMVFALRDGAILHRDRRELALIPLDDAGQPVRDHARDGSGKYATVYRDDWPSGRVAMPLTPSHVVRVLAEQGWDVGEDCARDVLALAGKLDVLSDTGAVLKPVAPGSHWEGGRKAQKSEMRSWWWRLYEIRFNRFHKRNRKPLLDPGPGRLRRGIATAYLCRFLRRQGLWLPSMGEPPTFAYGSVQAAFAALGPP